ARIVVFHGEINPPDAIAGRRNKSLATMRPARWVQTAWRDLA
ncbi:MAG: glycosyltransferase, partial [Burkholderiaceae bacterium]|nr:glycosyltransferase [Burkholderiaceae bacterium]